MRFDLTPDAVGRLCAVARRAGEAILAIYETDFEVAAKADASPVTEADEAAEAVILEACRQPGFDVEALGRAMADADDIH